MVSIVVLVDNRWVLHLEIGLSIVVVALMTIALGWVLLIVAFTRLTMVISLELATSILLVYVRLTVLKLDKSSIRVFVAVLSFMLLLHLPLLSLIVLIRRRWDEDLNRHVLTVHVLGVPLVLLHLVLDLRSHVLKVGRQWPTVRVLVLLEGAVPCNL